MRKTIAVILKGYPRLSETFIAQEIHALERAGIAITLFSLRRPTEQQTHPVHRAIVAPVHYLPEYLHRQPLRVWRAWRQVRCWSSYRAARKMWWRDFTRDRSCNRLRRFGQAVTLAAELPANIELLYAHFLHTPASVARYAAVLRNMPWSCSAHAKDIWTLPAWEKREKLAHCRWLTTCTRANLVHLQALTDAPHKVSLNYHGLNLASFSAASPRQSRRAGAADGVAGVVRILSVGRVVAKKGYRGLLDALAALPPALRWQFTHIGAGPLLPDCQHHAATLGLADKIRWLGAQSGHAVLAQYRRADFFVLNCRIEADGDRDGLPNVLVEAQALALAALATRISGIPELIEHDVNGLLVAADDRPALTAALQRLITEPALRHRLGTAGRAVVYERFDMTDNFRQLLEKVTDG